MIVQVKHVVIFEQRRYTFTVDVDCPFKPDPDFLFVFRSEGVDDDCALIIEEIYGWDASRNRLLVRTIPWDLDEWHSKRMSRETFEAVKRQLIEVVGCEYVGPSKDVGQ